MNQPQRNIMQLQEYDNADVYRVACSCGDTDHDVITWIEVRTDSDINEVEATFFVHGTSPTWTPGWSRWRAIWNLLWHGYHRSEHTLLLDQASAENFARALTHSVGRLKNQVDQKT